MISSSNSSVPSRQPSGLQRRALLSCLLAMASGISSGAAQETPSSPPVPVQAKTWELPVEGNTYLTSGQGGGRSGRGGVMGYWRSADSVYSLFFRVDRPADLEIALKAALPAGESKIRATIGEQVFEKELKAGEASAIPLGRVEVKAAGYLRVELRGLSRTGDVFAEVDALNVTPVGKGAEAVVLNYVKEGSGNRFYWGRRGPSVHLGYSLPQGEPLEWFYNEVTVPEGGDPVGSYFMSNGFGEGYFGMQVNSENERRVLFSVWSPFSTDNPKDIPADHRITLLKKGEEVHGGEFGGEGSGGQSFWLYPWKAGSTQRFLNRVQPDGKGSTVYSAWFFLPEKNDWKLIASFKRPLTDKHLTGAHSFLENFSDRQGYLGRQAFYGNQWACDVKGEWHEITEARFTGDDIAQRKYRLDYAGGAKGPRFFLKNGGFFPDNVALNTRFTREASSPGQKPVIDFTKLEGVAEGQ